MKWHLLPIGIAFLLASINAWSDTQVTPKKPVKKIVTQKRAVEAKTPVSKSLPEKTLTKEYSPRSIDPIPATSLNVTTPTEPNRRIINVRLHPLYFGMMLFDKNTEVAGRADIDFILSDKFTIGPSVSYTQSETLDEKSVGTQNLVGKSESFLEIGLLSNVYLTGHTYDGGLILRPHVYYVDPSGQYTDNTGATKDANTKTSGVRGGMELLYQVMLPSGFNLEAGGGFTYYIVPYTLDYGARASTTSASPFAPTISLGVGWAF